MNTESYISRDAIPENLGWRLPLELLWEIVEYVNLCDNNNRINTLLALRSTCFALRDYTTPYAFRIIRTQTTLEQFEKQVERMSTSGMLRYVEGIEINIRSMVHPGCKVPPATDGLEDNPIMGPVGLWKTFEMIEAGEKQERIDRMRYRETLTRAFQRVAKRLLSCFIYKPISVTLRAECSAKARWKEAQGYDLARMQWFFDAIGELDMPQLRFTRLCLIAPSMYVLDSLFASPFLNQVKDFQYIQSYRRRGQLAKVDSSNDIELQRGHPVFSSSPRFPIPRQNNLRPILTWMSLGSPKRDRVEQVRLHFSPSHPPTNFKFVDEDMYTSPDEMFNRIAILTLENAVYTDDTFAEMLRCLPYLKDLSLRFIHLSRWQTTWGDAFAALREGSPQLEELHLACLRYVSEKNTTPKRHTKSSRACDCVMTDTDSKLLPSDKAMLEKLRRFVISTRRQRGLDLKNAFESNCQRYSKPSSGRSARAGTYLTNTKLTESIVLDNSPTKPSASRSSKKKKRAEAARLRFQIIGGL